MVNKSFIMIILTIVLLGVIIYYLTNNIENYQNNQNSETEQTEAANQTTAAGPTRPIVNTRDIYYADLDDDDKYETLSANITEFKFDDNYLPGSRITLFKFNGKDAYLYFSEMDPYVNISMLIDISTSKFTPQTLIHTNKYTLQYTPDMIQYIYENNTRTIQLPLSKDLNIFGLKILIVNFNKRLGTVTLGFGTKDDLKVVRSEERVISANDSDKNFIYIGGKPAPREEPFFNGYIGKIKITGRDLSTENPQLVVEEVSEEDLSDNGVTSSVEEEIVIPEFVIRNGNSVQYTNKFLKKFTKSSEIVTFPVIGTRVTMFKFNENSAFDINNINSPDLTLYFAVQFNQLDYDESIVKGRNFEISLEDGNLVLVVNDEKRIIGVQTRRLYFLVLSINSTDFTITLRLDMFEESISFSDPSDIGSIHIGGYLENNNYFTGRIGNFVLITRTYTKDVICNASRLCQIIEESCSDYTEENKCNNSADLAGNKCEYNLVCVPASGMTGVSVQKCAQHTTTLACDNDQSCMVDTDNSGCRNLEEIPDYIDIPTTSTTQDISRPPPKNCSFKPTGITKEACVDRCSNQHRAYQINEDCNPAVCRLICDRCDTPDCNWKNSDKLADFREPNVPLPPKIKGYAGDSQVKLVWVAPYSISDITKYTCVIEGGNMGGEIRLDFPPDVNCSLCEYIINNLINSNIYSIYVICSNKEGDSLPSNIVSIMPAMGRELPSTGRKNELELNQIDDSLQEYKRVIEKGDISELRKLTNVEDKNKDYFDLLDLLVTEKKNNHQVNDKIKLELV
jgi:hypothetical protein